MARLLVIDDDLYIRSACSKISAKEGWSVVCTEDGAAGLRELQNSPNDFDVVLLDLLMPGIGGMVVLNRILSHNPNQAVIIMTGSATESSANEITEKGACDCLPKPFTPDELRTVVKRALIRKSQQS